MTDLSLLASWADDTMCWNQCHRGRLEWHLSYLYADAF